jgi:hypothetical protein
MSDDDFGIYKPKTNCGFTLINFTGLNSLINEKKKELFFEIELVAVRLQQKSKVNNKMADKGNTAIVLWRIHPNSLPNFTNGPSPS